MNIKYGMDNFYVKYLKRFLNTELVESNTTLGDFNKNDQSALIRYLNLPNVKDMFMVQKEIYIEFPQLNNLFNIQLKDDSIIWISKSISLECSEFLSQNNNAIRSYCESVGWELKDVNEWIDLSKDINGDGSVDELDREILNNIIHSGAHYADNIMKKADLNLDGVINDADANILNNYLLNGKLSLKIQKSKRNNYFPNQDMLVFINQFDNTFMYNYYIDDEIIRPDPTKLHKIALYKCKPGQKITIAHDNPKSQDIIIGCSSARTKQDVVNESFMLQNVVRTSLRGGESIQYTCSSIEDKTGYDANWVCIQCSSDYGDLSGSQENTIILNVGDINFDGQINMEDYVLLANYTAEGPGSEKYHWNPTPKQLAVMKITNRPGEDPNIINNDDTQALYNFITGTSEQVSLGITYYTYNQPSEYMEGSNISHFLIIDGHYDKTVNIPFDEFVTDPWIIHNKFFNYLLNMSIQKYSNGENITYLQKLLKEAYPEYSYDKNFFYPSYYSDNMKKVMRDYQLSKTHYTKGDLNRDNKIDRLDLQLLRDYLNDPDVIAYNLITEYINKEIELTPEQIKEYDYDHNGVLDFRDRDYYKGIVDNRYSAIFRSRADVNEDGIINEKDYELLQLVVEGKSNQLTKYDISFILGWCDVETEAMLEQDFNYYGNISEVSK